DSVANNPKKTLNQLTDYDLAIIAKPTEKFSEKEKFTLDQFVMNGGKSIWLIDNVQAELDSLMQTGETLAYPRDLGVTDMFFNYGFRLTNNLVTDLYSSQITLATGKVGNRTQFNAFPWKYYPLVQNTNSHPITNNIGPVNFKFAVAIDTLKNNIQKHILLQSSKLSKAVGTPSIVSLKSISNKENQNSFTKGNFPLALLLEGEFKSAYAGRVKPFSIENSKDKSVTNQLIVIGDGDLIANDVAQGKPLPLGYDKWTNEQYGNKNFLINCVNYLLDDKDLVSLRNKTVKIQFLNKQKAFDEALKWRIVNILVPLLILGVFGLLFNYFRKKKYQ
ncbi:MAG TPA: gliding motility-associated ABC transporter substrate-binding protein GldG, partial [Flavobacteriaceae bacterium]|nr:gliding motility-associated ABC transporter substrate-binding protein GldG [Flavobacteriaceae bacterium]